MLATVIWLLGGDPTKKGDKRGDDENNGVSASSNNKVKKSTSVRRLRWNNNAPSPEANSGDRISYYMESKQSQVSNSRGAPEKAERAEAYLMLYCVLVLSFF